MATFSLVIEYLTGYAVATDTGSREDAEWPPHPARVFMAMAAAHFESDGTPEEKRAQRAALEWLASLPPPDLVVPDAAPRDVLSVYVPVNDQSGGAALAQRSRQPRTFPRVYVGSEPVRLIYRSDAAAEPERMRALESICRQVTRIGHSSSLVWMRVEPHSHDDAPWPTHRSDPSGLGPRLRTPFASILQSLIDLYGEERRTGYGELRSSLDRLGIERKSVKGKGATAIKKQLAAQIQEVEDRLAEQYPTPPREPIRPALSHTTSYVNEAERFADLGVAESPFDPNFLVLRLTEGNRQILGLESTLQLVAALRKYFMDASGGTSSPPWISGHETNGEKLASSGHIAMAPLAYVGRPWVDVERHADGHLMGAGIFIPRDIALRERARVFSKIFFSELNEPRPISVKLNRAQCAVELERDTRFTLPLTLRPQTYTQASSSWASVTPMLLDRMPKNDRHDDPLAWREEVAEIIARSIDRYFSHLNERERPQPVLIRVEKTPFFHGSLRAMPGQGGFPQLREDKFQVHVRIDFDRLVSGPVVLGAGRFRGYGLFRAWQESEGR